MSMHSDGYVAQQAPTGLDLHVSEEGRLGEDPESRQGRRVGVED
jgi:hypothetical protein